MAEFKVIGTVREIECDSSTRITHLVCKGKSGRYIARNISLKLIRDEADANMYYVHPPGDKKSFVHVFEDKKHGWITRAYHDDEFGTNLLHLLPLYHIKNKGVKKCP